MFHFFVIRLQDSLFLFFFCCEIFTKNELKTIVFFLFYCYVCRRTILLLEFFVKGYFLQMSNYQKRTHTSTILRGTISNVCFFILFGYLTKKRVSNHNWFANFSLKFCFRFRVDNFASEHLQKGFFFSLIRFYFDIGEFYL